MPLVTAAVRLPVSAEAAFAFHSDVRNLLRLMPFGVRLRSAATSPTRQGDCHVLLIGFGPLARPWLARVERLEEGRLLIDVQEEGPFRRFRHAHLFLPAAEGSVMIDAIDFRLLPDPLGLLLDGLVVAPAVRLVFAWRQRRTRRLLAGRSGVRPTPPGRALASEGA